MSSFGCLDRRSVVRPGIGSARDFGTEKKMQSPVKIALGGAGRLWQHHLVAGQDGPVAEGAMSEQLNERHGPYEVVERLEALSAALAGHPLTQALHPPLDAMADAVEAAHKDWRRAVARRTATTGRIEYFDHQLREPFMKAARHIGTETNNNREAIEYKTVYPNEPPSELIRPVGGENQAREVRRVIHVLRTDPVVAAFAHHADPIEQAHEKVLTEEKHRDVLDLEASAKRTVLDRKLAEARRLYNSVEADLLDVFEHDRKQVRAFYA